MFKTFLFCLGLLVAAYFLSYNSLKSIYTSFVARSWPKATATLTMAEVGFHSSHEDGEASDRFSFNVKYHYTVNGKKYQSTRFAVCLFQESSSQALAPLVEKYQVGSQVQVFYNAEKPSYSIIHTGFFFTPWLYTALALGLALFAISLAITEIRQHLTK